MHFLGYQQLVKTLGHMLHTGSEGTGFARQAWKLKWLMDTLFGLPYNCEHARTYVTHGTSIWGLCYD